MSTEKLAEIQEDFLTCEICLCPFSSDSSSPKAPKVLSCLHTFCREDLSKAISPGDEQVECFVCRVPTELDRVKGVQTVQSIQVTNKVGGSYSQYGYDIKGATRNNTVYPSYDPCIFEVKFPDTDIIGRVTTL